MVSEGVELIARNLDARTANTLSFFGRGVDSSAPTGVDITNLAIANVYDGVNKIN